MVTTAGSLSLSVSRPPSTSRVTIARAVAHLDLGGERRLRQVGERGQHLAGLVAVVVDRLLAEDDQARLLLVDQRLQQLGDRERLQLVVALDQDRPVGADRHRRAQRLLALLDAARDRDHLGDDALLLQAHGLLDGDLVERVHAHLDVGDVDAGAVGLDAHLDVVVDDALDGDENFHRAAPASEGSIERSCYFSHRHRRLPFSPASDRGVAAAFSRSGRRARTRRARRRDGGRGRGCRVRARHRCCAAGRRRWTMVLAGRGGNRSSQKNCTSAVWTLNRCHADDCPTLITARLPWASQNSFARAMPRVLMSTSSDFRRRRWCARGRRWGRSSRPPRESSRRRAPPRGSRSRLSCCSCSARRHHPAETTRRAVSLRLVPGAGFEPASCVATGFKPAASTDFATRVRSSQCNGRGCPGAQRAAS